MSDEKAVDPIELFGRAWVNRNEAGADVPGIERSEEAEDVGYARRSSPSGTEVSIERQEEGILRYATLTGRKVTGTFADRGKSGATLRGRDGLNEIMRRAKEGKVNKVIVEDVDRLGRDLALLATCFKELTKLGVEIHSVAKGGKLELSDIAMRGFLSQEQRQIIMRNCAQGRKKLAAKGLVPSGKCWGYLGVPGKPGHLVVDPDTQPHVEMFFEKFVAGATPKAIAEHANAMGVKCPRGGLWTQSQVRRVLANPRYAGKLVYGRRSFHIDLDTGVRTVTPQPTDEWVSRVDEKLRIVTDELWFTAQELLAPKRSFRRSPERNYLLSKKITCPECGGSMGVRTARNSITLIRCANASNKGSAACSHTRLYPMKDIERGVLGFLRPFLDDPETIESYFSATRVEHDKRVGGAQKALEKADADVRLARERLDRFFDNERELIEDIGQDEVSRQRRRYSQALQEAQRISAGLRAVARQTPPVDRKAVETLTEAFGLVLASTPFRPSDVAGQHVAAILRDLIDRVDLHPAEGSNMIHLRIWLALGTHAVIEGLPATESDVVVDGVIGIDPHYAARSKNKRDDLVKLLNERHGFMSDAQWLIAERALGQYAPRARMKGFSVRELLDRVFFALRHGRSFASVAPRSGSKPVDMRGFAHYLAHKGYWDRIVQALWAEDRGFLIGVPRDFFERYRANYDQIDRSVAEAGAKRREQRAAEGKRSRNLGGTGHKERISKFLVPPLLARLDAREDFMSDAIYACIEPIAAEYKPRKRKHGIPARELLDRIFFCLRTGLPLSHASMEYSEGKLNMRVVGHYFAETGLWDRIVKRLETEAPEFLVDTDYRFFDRFKDHYAAAKVGRKAAMERYLARQKQL